MARAWSPDEAADSGQLANLFVLIAVVAMLVGTVLIIAARDPTFVEVPAGEAVEVLYYEAPDSDPFGHPLFARFSSNESFNLSALETTGSGKSEFADIPAGNWSTWTFRAVAERGEVWSVTVTSMGNQTLQVATTVSHNSMYTAGGVLVGIGVLGFVSYRMGMRRSGP